MTDAEVFAGLVHNMLEPIRKKLEEIDDKLTEHINSENDIRTRLIELEKRLPHQSTNGAG